MEGLSDALIVSLTSGLSGVQNVLVEVQPAVKATTSSQGQAYCCFMP